MNAQKDGNEHQRNYVLGCFTIYKKAIGTESQLACAASKCCKQVLPGTPKQNGYIQILSQVRSLYNGVNDVVMQWLYVHL